MISHKIENDKQVTRKATLTMDAAKQKITALEEGETEIIILTRKK